MEMSYSNILVAIDGSEPAKLSFKKGIEMAKRHNADLHLVHVVDTSPYRGIEMYDVNFTKRLMEQAEILLNQYKEDAKSKGINNVQVILKQGSPKKLISRDAAKEASADVILCGATGVNAVERILMGSVSENIARYAVCDVLIVRNNKDTAD